MKKKEIKDIKELTLDELSHKESGLREELFNLKFQYATGQLDNVMRITEVKRGIARVLTVVNDKKRVAAK